jgi:peptide deformylase
VSVTDPRSTFADHPPDRVLNRGIVVYPDRVLTMPSMPLIEFDERMVDFARWLRAARDVHNALGVAACQLGIPLRAFLFVDGRDVHVVVNPEIVERREPMAVEVESCLSLPGARAQVRRHTGIALRGFTPEGEEWEFDTDAPLTAAAIQHEMDHLDGVLYIRHLTRQRARDCVRRIRVPS